MAGDKKFRMILILGIALLLPYGDGFSQEMQNVFETFTVEKEGLSSWKKKEDACYYAIASVRRKGKYQCESKKERGGKFVKYDKEKNEKSKFESCTGCYQTKYSKNWKCSGRVVVRCRTKQAVENVGSEGVAKKAMQTIRRDSMKRSKQRLKLGSPCTKNIYSRACREYRKKRSAGGVRN